MITATIEELAYLMKQAKEEGLPQPIVFLGAGASKTGGVPLASEIINDILEKYKDSPKIKSLNNEPKTYAKLMECLTPFERNKLLKGYINNAKINVTHLYLAQLLIHGYVDYVLTVNFDNLMLRALALFNNFPATYDMAILKDLTTTSFKEKSVVYLHGQHHGLWLLNTTEEMEKVKEIIPPILNGIKDQRPWIFLGYSGEDPIFEHIIKLGRFDNGLYWVTYNENNPNPTVCDGLLEKPNTNAHLIKGFDSDSFILKLNAELNLSQPEIIDKPFTSLKNTLQNIVDIDDDEHFKGVKERLEIAKTDVGSAINQFEKGEIKLNKTLKHDVDINLLKKQIINKIIKKDFNAEEIKSLQISSKKLKNKDIDRLLGTLFRNWAEFIKEQANSKNDEKLYNQSIEKYETASILNPKLVESYDNWGIAIFELFQINNDKTLIEQSIEKYKKALEINPDYFASYYNWGTLIYHIANLNQDVNLFNESFELFKTAIKLNPKYSSAYCNWGLALKVLADIELDALLYESSIEKLNKAIELKPNDSLYYELLGKTYKGYAILKNDEKLFKDSFEKFKIASELNSNDFNIYYNWASSIFELYKIKKSKELFNQSIELFRKNITLGGNYYNLACLYAYENNKEEALKNLSISLDRKEIEVDFVKKDSDWINFLKDFDFKNILIRHSK